MRILTTMLLALILGGCVSIKPELPYYHFKAASNSVLTAQPYVGLNERADRTALRELTGVDPVRTEWCAAFVNSILSLDGIANLYDLGSEYPLVARQFLLYGEAVEPDDIRIGDLVIFPRGNSSWQGHVGFFVKAQGDHWIILGGNQSNTVRYDLYNPKRALGIRRYTETTEVQQTLQ